MVYVDKNVTCLKNNKDKIHLKEIHKPVNFSMKTVRNWIIYHFIYLDINSLEKGHELVILP